MPLPFARPPSPAEKAQPPRGVLTVHKSPIPPGTTPEGVAALHEHLTASRAALESVSHKLSQLAHGPRVLETRTFIMPAGGVYEADRFRIPYASIAVMNPGASALVITTSPAQGGPPGQGQGQAQVPANCFVAWNMAGSSLSIYGAAALVVTYTVFVDAIQPFASAL